MAAVAALLWAWSRKRTSASDADSPGGETATVKDPAGNERTLRKAELNQLVWIPLGLYASGLHKKIPQWYWSSLIAGTGLLAEAWEYLANVRADRGEFAGRWRWRVARVTDNYTHTGLIDTGRRFTESPVTGGKCVPRYAPDLLPEMDMSQVWASRDPVATKRYIRWVYDLHKQREDGSCPSSQEKVQEGDYWWRAQAGGIPAVNSLDLGGLMIWPRVLETPGEVRARSRVSHLWLLNERGALSGHASKRAGYEPIRISADMFFTYHKAAQRLPIAFTGGGVENRVRFVDTKRDSAGIPFPDPTPKNARTQFLAQCLTLSAMGLLPLPDENVQHVKRSLDNTRHIWQETAWPPVRTSKIYESKLNFFGQIKAGITRGATGIAATLLGTAKMNPGLALQGIQASGLLDGLNGAANATVMSEPVIMDGIPWSVFYTPVAVQMTELGSAVDHSVLPENHHPQQAPGLLSVEDAEISTMGFTPTINGVEQTPADNSVEIQAIKTYDGANSDGIPIGVAMLPPEPTGGHFDNSTGNREF